MSTLEGSEVLLKKIPSLLDKKPVIVDLKHPFIVIEGLDGTGWFVLSYSYLN